MKESPIPPDVREFALRHIDSIAQMEALRLLRADATMHWDSVTLAARLYITEDAASEVLDRLLALGVVARDAKGSCFRCASQELETSVGRLVDAYNSYLIPITNLIHGKTASRIREFADAFHFVKGR